MKKIALLSAVAGAAFSMQSFAQDAYVGGSMSFMNYSEAYYDDASLTSLTAIFGKQYNENLAGEFRFGFGLGGDTVNADGFNIDLKLKNMMGAYLKAGAPTSGKLYPYAMIGFTRAELEASVLGYSVSDDDSSLSFGLGVDYQATQAVKVSAEYMNYLSGDYYDINGFALSLSKSF